MMVEASVSIPGVSGIPNTKSAEKRLRQGVKRRERNDARKRELKRAIKQVEKAIRVGDRERAEALIPQLMKAADKAARHRAVHPNRAARIKARLMKRVQTLA